MRSKARSAWRAPTSRFTDSTMDSDTGAECGVWRCDWLFYERIRARGAAIMKEKVESANNVGCQTEEVQAHVDWISDEFTDAWVPEPSVSLFEDDEDLDNSHRWRSVDFDHSHRWRSVKAREVDKPITMVYTRESKKSWREI